MPRSLLRSARRTPFLVGVVLSALIVLAACGEDATPTPEPTVAPLTVIPATATPMPVPTATATATSTPSPTATPAATETPAIATTPTPTDTDTTLYTNDIYGFSVRIPNGWTTTRLSPIVRSIVTQFDTGSEDVSSSVFVLYFSEPRTAQEVAEEQLASVSGLTAFRTVIDGPVTLSDGSEAFQTLYGFGTGSNEQRGALTFAVRGTQAVGVQVQAPRTTYERSFEEMDTLINSLTFTEQQPYGLPRDETLVVAFDSGPLTLDPAVAQESSSIQYINQIFDGLVRLDENLAPVSDLATWDVSADGLTYTFTLVEGAAFHGGRAVTGADVVYSWERALNPDVGSGVAISYMNDIVGATDYFKGEADTISGLSVIDDRTLTVTIDSAKSYFIAKLTHSAASVVDRANTETGILDADGTANPWWYTPVGTGPYAVAEFDPRTAILLTRSPDHHGTPAHVENVVFRFYSGLTTPMVADGEVDAGSLALSEYNALVADEAPLLDNVSVTPALSIFYVGFNAAIEPFDDPSVRRAFLMSVDRDAINEQVLDGTARVAHGLLPPGIPGYDEEIVDIPFSPEQARALLEDSSYGGAEGLPDIVFTIPTRITPTLQQMASMWREHLGVDVAFQIIPGRLYFSTLSETIANLYQFGWIADYPDPHNFLDTLFHTGADNNLGNVGSETIDRLLEQARIEQDTAARLELYGRIERMLVASAAAIPLWFGEERLLVADRVDGFVASAQGFVDLTLVTLNPDDDGDTDS